MKKSLIALIACALLFSLPGHARYYNDSGFSHSLDVGARYGIKYEAVLVDVGYNLGYKFPFGLYIGAGPTVVGGTLANIWSPSIAVGGYGKVCYTAVQINAEVLPFIELRGGYKYEFEGKKDHPIFGGGIGILLKERFRLGVFCNMETYDGIYTWTTREKLYDGWTDPYTGHKVETKYITETHQREKTMVEIAPTIIFTYEF